MNKQECDEAFQFLGYESFYPISNKELLNKIDRKRYKLGNKITNQQRMFLINALRCNNICSYNQPNDEIDHKLTCIFDEVDSADYCNNYISFPNDCCLLIYKIDDYYLTKPVKKGSYYYKSLIKEGYYIVGCEELNIDINIVQVPINVDNIQNIQFMVKSCLIKNNFGFVLL